MEQRLPPPFKVLLIGGVSGVGKSKASATLARQLGVPWLQVDDLRLSLQYSGLIEREQHPDLFSFLDRSDWHTSPEIYRDKLIAVGQIMARTLRIVAESHIATDVPVIIEGDGIIPEFAATITSEYGEGVIHSVFIVEDDTDFLKVNLSRRERGTKTTDEIRMEVQATMLYSKWIEQQAQQYNLPIIRPLPWESLVDRVSRLWLG